ncbi:MAG TPA: hypothetical protein VK795_03820 [Terriglobales bacterium]|nr:hypothetical protein [Terriglobales bacterium]
MRRTQAIVVVLVLLASPLSLLARASFGMDGDCNNLCCLIHGSHAGHAHMVTPKTPDKDMACHHGEAGHAIECTMKARHSGPDFGFFAPIAPTTPSALVTVTSPSPSRTGFTRPNELIISGFLEAPFEPPRS